MFNLFEYQHFYVLLLTVSLILCFQPFRATSKTNICIGEYVLLILKGNPIFHIFNTISAGHTYFRPQIAFLLRYKSVYVICFTVWKVWTESGSSNVMVWKRYKAGDTKQSTVQQMFSYMERSTNSTYAVSPSLSYHIMITQIMSVTLLNPYASVISLFIWCYMKRAKGQMPCFIPTMFWANQQ